MAEQRDIKVKFLYDPSRNPKQLKAHAAEEENILYGGAKGGGKTAWLVNEGLRLSLSFPGNRGFLGCKHFDDFRDNALKQVEKFVPASLILNHHKTEHYITLRWTEYNDPHTGLWISKAPKGQYYTSVIMYGGIGSEEEAYQQINNMPELGWFGIDQAEQISERQFQLLHGQLRLNLPGIKYKALLTANPEPGWLRDRFIENSHPNHLFVPALPSDNPFLPPDYADKLREMFPAEMARRLLEGDWDVETEGNYLIPYSLIREAINRELESKGDKIAGVDISRYGMDETVFILRQGNKILDMVSWSHQDTIFSAGRIGSLIREHKPKITYIDAIGVGAGVFDLLSREGLPVRAINVGERALDTEQYANKRAEYFKVLAKKFEKGEIDIPDNVKLQAQLSSLKYLYDNRGRMLIESKEQMRKEGKKSPDFADALMLAFIGSDIELFEYGAVDSLHWR